MLVKLTINYSAKVATGSILGSIPGSIAEGEAGGMALRLESSGGPKATGTKAQLPRPSQLANRLLWETSHYSDLKLSDYFSSLNHSASPSLHG